MHPVLRTVMQRLGLGVLTLFFVSCIIFLSMQLLPGNFAYAILGQSATPETVAAFEHEVGLDKPALTRYVDWIEGVAQGDFGNSFADYGSSSPRTVAELIAPRLWNTLFLAAMTAPSRCRWPWGWASWPRFIATACSIGRSTPTLTTISFPEFFVAYILMLFLAVKFPAVIRFPLAVQCQPRHGIA